MTRRRSLLGNKREKKLFTKRFYPAGTYTWVVPTGCTEVDVFLVGGGAGGEHGGGGGYTKTYKKASDGWKDGNAISVTQGQSISIIVGAGGAGGSDGGYSQFLSSSYRANGGTHGYTSGKYHYGGNGGSGGGAYGNGGSDGNDGDHDFASKNDCIVGQGQGHTTRDFGESYGNRNAGGGAGQSILSTTPRGGASDYTQGSGEDGNLNPGTSGSAGKGGGGYGGGGGSGRGGGTGGAHGRGGDGTVLIRYYAYEQ